MAENANLTFKNDDECYVRPFCIDNTIKLAKARLQGRDCQQIGGSKPANLRKGIKNGGDLGRGNTDAASMKKDKVSHIRKCILYFLRGSFTNMVLSIAINSVPSARPSVMTALLSGPGY